MVRHAWLPGLGVLAAVLVLLGVRTAATDVATPRDLSSVPYAGSPSCRACHMDHQRSWQATFHRTMTQTPNAATVLGDFEDRTLTFDGVTSHFFHKDGAYFVATPNAQGEMESQQVLRLVGSRRFQHLLVKEKDHLVRLPVAWDVAEQRWFHLNGGFLDPDGTPFNAHRALWNANCIFCHNVKAQPGYAWETASFDSRVEEMGIACEACHGPGADHVRVNANPLRRYYLHTTNAADPSIVAPNRLSPLREVQVCGHCHGQRVPHPLERIRSFLSEGDPFTPGEDLGAVTSPLFRDSKVQGLDVAVRFWRDGTPRLSAYEYQGLLLSGAHVEKGLTCSSCHSAHGGDPKGMIAQENRTNAACLGCHAKMQDTLEKHTGHKPGSSGSSCYACHMPRSTYGLVNIHRSHRIQSPDPSRAWLHAMPEACTLCHVDRAAPWAAVELARMNGTTPPTLPGDASFQVAESVRALLAGDVVQRAVAADALAQREGDAALWAAPFLILAMEDRYAAVRMMAYRALRDLAARRQDTALPATLLHVDVQADEQQRREDLEALRRWWELVPKAQLARPGEAVPLDASWLPVMGVVEGLRRQQPLDNISIGE